MSEVGLVSFAAEEQGTPNAISRRNKNEILGQSRQIIKLSQSPGASLRNSINTGKFQVSQQRANENNFDFQQGKKMSKHDPSPDNFSPSQKMSDLKGTDNHITIEEILNEIE